MKSDLKKFRKVKLFLSYRATWMIEKTMKKTGVCYTRALEGLIERGWGTMESMEPKP